MQASQPTLYDHLGLPVLKATANDASPIIISKAGGEIEERVTIYSPWFLTKV